MRCDSKPNNAPINWPVEPWVWTFSRGSQRLEISRHVLDDGTALIIAGEGAPRSYFFENDDRLNVFQKDMETLLLKTGWTFVSYSPDRRSGRDRRGFPRRANDRRRWWTDGIARAKTGASPAAPGQTPDWETDRPRRVPK